MMVDEMTVDESGRAARARQGGAVPSLRLAAACQSPGFPAQSRAECGGLTAPPMPTPAREWLDRLGIAMARVKE